MAFCAIWELVRIMLPYVILLQEMVIRDLSRYMQAPIEIPGLGEAAIDKDRNEAVEFCGAATCSFGALHLWGCR